MTVSFYNITKISLTLTFLPILISLNLDAKDSIKDGSASFVGVGSVLAGFSRLSWNSIYGSNFDFIIVCNDFIIVIIFKMFLLFKLIYNQTVLQKKYGIQINKKKESR